MVGPDGTDVPLRLVGEDETDEVGGDHEGASVLGGVADVRVRRRDGEAFDPSILRNFSAPVKLTTDLPKEDLIFLMANDSDLFNKWEAGQTLLRETLLKLVEDAKHGKELVLDDAIVDAVQRRRRRRRRPGADKAFIARAMALPSESNSPSSSRPRTPT